MTGAFLVQSYRAVTNVLPRIPKLAIASSLLGTIGVIHSLSLKNNTYLMGALLWTVGSCAVGYFTKKKVNQMPSNILNHAEFTKISVTDFSFQTKALYSNRCKVAKTTHEQRKKFYYLMCVSHLFSPSEKKQLGNALNTLNILRPYMEDSLYLDAKIDIKNPILSTPTVISGYILRHRDAIRLQALEEFEKHGKIPLNVPRFNLAIGKVFEAIAKGILEKPSVQTDWENTRRGEWGIHHPYKFGEDDALLYFERKFYKFKSTPILDTSNPRNRFFEVKPIHSHVTTIRSTNYQADSFF